MRTSYSQGSLLLVEDCRSWFAAILNDFDPAAAAGARHDLERARRLVARIERDLSALEDAVP